MAKMFRVYSQRESYPEPTSGSNRRQRVSRRHITGISAQGCAHLAGDIGISDAGLRIGIAKSPTSSG